MNVPTWDKFIAVNAGNKQSAFEALARMLFKSKYNLKDNLAYFRNHPGNETDTIIVNGSVIGFQAKFFEGSIVKNEIIESMRKAKSHNPNQTDYIIYTNAAFGIPKGGKPMTAGQKDVEDEANHLGLKLEWWFGDNVLDAASKDSLINDLFFNPDISIRDLDRHIESSNVFKFSAIQDSISTTKGLLCVDRSAIISEINTILKDKKNVIVTGESGSGKTAVVKRFLEEKYITNDSAYYFLNASQFNTTQINTLFSLHVDYTIVDFCRFYKETQNKVVVIDSAEKLLEIENDIVLTMFVKELSKYDWGFIFTCREHSKTELLQKLDNLLNNQIETVSIEQLTEQELESYANQYNIILPKDNKLRNRLRTLFYLARFVELNNPNAHTMSLTAFRDEVWRQKVKGLTRGAISQYREDCLLSLVKYQVENISYYIPKQGVNHDAAYALVVDDVLVDGDKYGYAIKHDIYIEFALDYLIDIEFYKAQQNARKFIHEIGSRIQYINAFSRWLSDKIDYKDYHTIDKFVELISSQDTPQKWVDCIFTCICKSKEYAPLFFGNNHDLLVKDNYALLNRILTVMIISCQEITSYLEYKGKSYPMFSSVGSGWAAAVDFVYSEGDKYYSSNLQFIQPLCENFRKQKRQPDITTRRAGLLVLKIFEMEAEAIENGKRFHISNAKPWCSTLLAFSASLSDKIKTIFQRIIDNQWFDSLDPYFDFVSYIAKIELPMNLLPLAATNMELLLDIIEGLWFYQRNEEDVNQGFRIYQRHYESEYYFGMNHEFLDLTYMPSSALQTPFGFLLGYERTFTKENKVLDKLLSIINRATTEYVKHPYSGDELYDVQIGQPDGSMRTIKGSYSLWNMYRGTSGFLPPYALVSLHMALEKYLLDLMKEEENHSYVKEIINRLILESHSCSLIAIVASVVTAYPDEFYDESLWLLQDLRLLSFDMMRYSREISANDFIMAFPERENHYNDRKTSKELKHRKLQLENLLTNYQVIYDHNKDDDSQKKLEVLEKIVDKLKSQLLLMPENEQGILSFVISRVDYKSMTKKQVKLENGVDAIQFEPNLTQEQIKDTEKTKRDSSEMLRGINLRYWAENRAKMLYDKINNYPYENNPALVLAEVENITTQLKENPNGIYMLCGDEFLPAIACSVLLSDFYKDLTQDQRIYCKDTVRDALRTEGFMMSSPMSGFDICLNAIPSIIEHFPEEMDRWGEIILYYANIRHETGNYRACDKVRNLVSKHKLWQNQRDLMNKILNSFSTFCKSKDCMLTDYDIANTLMSLIPSGITDETLRRTAIECMESLSLSWKKKDNGYYSSSEDRLSVSYVIADYILNANDADIEDLVKPFARYLDPDDNYNPLLNAFLITCAEHGLYKKFWEVWNIFLPDMIGKIKYGIMTQNLNSFLLNPSFLRQDSNDWFILDLHDIDFFKKVADKIAYHPSCIFSIAKVYCTIGEKYYLSAIPIIAKIVSVKIQRIEDYKSNVVFYLDQLMMKVFIENRDMLNNNKEFHAHIEKILNFLIGLGSKEASQHLQTL